MSKNIDDMTPEELKAYEESLDKEISTRNIKQKESELQNAKEADATKAEEAKKAAWEKEFREKNDVPDTPAEIDTETETEDDKEAKQKALWEEEYLKEHPELQPKPKISDKGTEIKNTGDLDKMQTFYNGYKKRNDKFETKSQYARDRSELDNIRFQVRNGEDWGECGFDGLFGNTDSDTGCEDVVTAWSPADTYAKVIWETFVCTADLLRICVKGLAINPGDGLDCQIRVFGAFGAPAAKNACECGSCASITFTTHQLTLAQYNLEAIICEKDIWDVGSILMDAYIKSMANSWAQWFDAQIYAQLETATPGTTERLPADLNCTPGIAGSCCTDASLVNLYNAVHAIVATMREATAPQNPDYLILSPTVAAIFKRMQTPTPMPWMGDITFDDSGRLKKMGGLKVIEYCGANSCTDLASEVVAIVIDSRRAVGCVFGQKPKTYKFFQTNCNSTRIDQWAFVAIGELDTAAIGHVINAA